ncbi:flavodoxin family protein [Clostridium sardiniense]|uniref:Flavodoxin family protein n=1 Tax=Clostridium sardiniense TaxID=29369 RepID=A0ABS7KVV1_CLOSR|nr:flavodoxin family protein [Clostridium sardiniense]MBY0754941.1 flavodoxin family protein [Clostridium sardiniense]MDQ0461878.1 NAD(P)H dehydrogenase (quinone) [Clostridium sardiniense]
MKVSILYDSKSGHTREVGEIIKKGIERVDGIEIKCMNIEEIDKEFLDESKGVVFGTPTYLANTTANMKKWLDDSHDINLEGKLASFYATADYIWGGADTAILTLINQIIVKGMLIYSGGAALGKPFIHLGYISVNGVNDKDIDTPMIFGERIGKKVKELF